jgi:polyisoprenoid-binding protein YceI
MKTKLFYLFAAMVLSVATRAQSVWTFDKNHTEIEFHATHLVITEVTGKFKSFDGKIISSREDFDGSEVEFTADAASISTDNEMRDNHLKSDDFFNAEKYPRLKFHGKIVKSGTKYQLAGELTIRDITKPVTLDVTYKGTVKDPFSSAPKAGFELSGTINRFDYDLKWNKVMEAGGAIVGSEIGIECNVELQKQVDL